MEIGGEWIFSRGFPFLVQFHSLQLLFMEFAIGSSWDKLIKSIKFGLLNADFFFCSAGNNRVPDAALYETCAVGSNPLKQIRRIETQFFFFLKANKQTNQKLSRSHEEFSHEEFSLGKQKKKERFPMQLHCPKHLVVVKH